MNHPRKKLLRSLAAFALLSLAGVALAPALVAKPGQSLLWAPGECCEPAGTAPAAPQAAPEVGGRGGGAVHHHRHPVAGAGMGGRAEPGDSTANDSPTFASNELDSGGPVVEEPVTGYRPSMSWSSGYRLAGADDGAVGKGSAGGEAGSGAPKPGGGGADQNGGAHAGGADQGGGSGPRPPRAGVPEPPVLVLLLVGFAGLIVMRRRSLRD